MDSSKRKKRLNRWQKALITVLALVLLYTIGGFLVAPSIIRSQATKILREQAGLDSSFDAIRVNPYSLVLEVEGFRAGPPGASNWVSLKKLHANLQIATLFETGFVVRDVHLDQPELWVHLDEAGAINWLTLMERLPKSTNATPAEIPVARIGHLSVSNAIVRWQDDFVAKGFTSALTDVDILLTNVHTLQTNHIAISATLDDSTSLSADADVALKPSAARLTANLTALNLARYSGYLPGWSPLTLQRGELSGDLRAEGRLTPSGLSLEITDGGATISQVDLVTRADTNSVLSLESVAVTGLAADLDAQTATLKQLTISGPSVAVHRDQDGAINWLNWVESTLAQLPPSTNSAPWKWQVDTAQVTGASVRLRDDVPQPGVSLIITNATLSADGISDDLRRSLLVKIGFELVSGGQGTIEGTITPLPVSADVTVAIEDLYFPVGEPYAKDQIALKLHDGTVSINGHAQVALAEAGSFTANYLGDIGVQNMVAHELQSDVPFFSVKSVDVRALEADWPLDDFKLQSVMVEEPGIVLYMRRDGTANVENIVPVSMLETLYRQLSDAWKLLQFEVDQVTVTNGHAIINDFSIDPAFSSEMTNLLFTLEGLKPESTMPATFNIGGRVNRTGLFSVVGEFHPSTNLSGKVSILSQSISIPPGSPYAGRYVGHFVDQGTVSVDLKYELERGIVKGENRVVVDQFEFGGSQDSTNAVKLPVKLGVAILKDRNGRIELDVPIEGDLRDPEIRLGRVIWKAFSNIFTKAMTAPFKFLGSLIGAGEEEDLSTVEFAAGSSELDESGRRKIDLLSRALFERPQLKLEIAGRYDPLTDGEALRQQAFEKSLDAFIAGFPQNERMEQLGRLLSKREVLGRDRALQFFYIDSFNVPFDVPARTPPEIVATREIGTRTIEFKDQEALLKQAPATGSKSVTAESAVPSSTARIVENKQPLPVLPELPGAPAMAARLKEELPIRQEELDGLADARARAVQDHLAAKPDLDSERVVIKADLSEPGKTAQKAAVFMGIF